MKYEIKNGRGWGIGNIPPLEYVVDAFDEIASLIYELKNCNRTMSLQEMKYELMRHIETMKESLEEINDDDEIVEVEE